MLAHRRVLIVVVLSIVGCSQPTESNSPKDSLESTKSESIITNVIRPNESEGMPSIRIDERIVDGISIMGALTDDDVSGIRSVVEAMPAEIDKRVLSICFGESGEVEVTTGESEGPLSGHGNLITLQKTGKEWVVMKTELWKS